MSSTQANFSPSTDVTAVSASGNGLLSPYGSPPASPRESYTKKSVSPSTSATKFEPTTLIGFQQQQGSSQQNGALRVGEIKLIGAGPGDPDLLTMAAYKAITSWADIVLADKLVSKEILSLITCPLFVANKDKGCQASGQQELFERATLSLQQGMKVVRLKQGGYEPTIVPGLSSAVTGPLLANIPLTHRGTASQFLVCTGTGLLDTIPDMPTYVAHRTTVFLMALHRLESLIKDLVRAGYPDQLPVAIVERASTKDQRCVRATIGTVVQVVKEVGYRPPGIMVAGWACDALTNNPHRLHDLAATAPSEI
ncbi:hypothetical protein BGZ98_001729 [Dissophora globulifera]|nr:hypothetical protein BGZ98_001729 [Dissophora globulifera]